jgi:tRNA threonylcarbamoyladenosine biosynthesis protein TsaE
MIAPHLRCGDTLALRGDLGAGKTTLARGLIRALCGEVEVPSPTYTLVQIYETPQGELWHGDMYRLESPQACHELGLEDAFLDAICLIEWPDNLGVFLPQSAINVSLSFQETSQITPQETSQETYGRWLEISGGAPWISALELS